ncbi:MAG: DNA methyltransferase [Acetobacteraceae bacterium]
MSKAPDAGQRARLRRLAALPDDQIDTSDLPVIEDWSQGVRGGTPRDVRGGTSQDVRGGAPQDVRRQAAGIDSHPGGTGVPAVEAFIGRWQGREGGQERANYALFLSELCDVLGVARPDPASATTEANDYVFERVVQEFDTEGSVAHRRIDLYKRGCFVLEAKQSRQKGGNKEVLGQPDMFAGAEPSRRGARSASRAWDVLMFNARRQAEGYARALPVSHGWPPFILVCDVGHVLEVYADFSGQGKNYAQFPDRQSFRVYLEDLRDAAVRERLVQIWTDPLALDPARKSARVTRAIAERLAVVSKALEAEHHAPEDVAMFLMRCLFTMFAEDVELLPKASFRNLLERCEQDPDRLGPMVGQLWEAMDRGDFAIAIEARVRRFNGEFFKTRSVLPLKREAIGELRQAASHDWRDVDPSIFGTLLEQALDAKERRRLGAHYTPRAYVERLVVATIIEPLRADWDRALSTAERQKAEGRVKDAVATITAFHETLCRTRILDPACGTGNFLYVSLELVKRLEGEVLEALADLGGQEALHGLEGHTVDPRQFLGWEVNPRAAAIAELVLWIGYLQWHLRTQNGLPSEPILKAFHNIAVKDAVLKADVTLVRDKGGKPVTRVGPDGAEVEMYRYDNPRRPVWPEAEFIVGNPPFIGGKDLRSRLGDEYAEALWAAHPDMNESADYVMYWWDHAAGLLTQPGTVLRRFGLVTTNSIAQVFQRRVIERHFDAKSPMSIVMAIPDHPWTTAAPDSAAVRIAMTVGEAGTSDGVVREVIAEFGADTDTPRIELSELIGHINSDLTIGVDVTKAVPLSANEGICSPGVKLHGQGFIVSREVAKHLGLDRRPGLNKHIREYRNGRDLTQRPRHVMVIDLFGYTEAEVRRQYPEVYQHVLETVKPGRDANTRGSYRINWWVFGEPRREIRQVLQDLRRYIATVETAKHRVFQFLDGSILPDNKLIAIASDDASLLGVLSSKIHTVWALRAGGWLGIGNDPVYVKSDCFDPFPFPVMDESWEHRIRSLAEDLDAHRKRVLAEHPHLTLTGLYNVLEKLRAGTDPAALSPADRRIFDDGLVLILKELHDRLDAAVALAYGWPADLSDNDILARLVALNRERAQEEANGLVRWLRPDYQIPRFGSAQQKAQLSLQGGAMHEAVAPAATVRLAFPTDETAQTAAVMAVLAATARPLGSEAVAARFRQGRRVVPKVGSVLGALQRMGFVSTPDEGRTWSLRRVA